MQTFFDKQLKAWPLAADNFAALDSVEVRELSHGVKVQYNPARIVSTGAKVDAASLKHRPCFLCRAHRPMQQSHIDWDDYEILVNPYPIFPHHFTIPLRRHQPQRIYGRVADMARLAERIGEGYTIFYNGPHCGASAPDHMHFQAGDSGFLPIWEQLPPLRRDAVVAATVFGGMGVIVVTASTARQMQQSFDEVYRALPVGEDEPMLNLLMRVDPAVGYVAVVIPRRRHRPSFYGDGEGQMLLSPASVDLAGVLITPRREDFDGIDDTVVAEVIAELCLSPGEVEAICRRVDAASAPTVSVGILADDRLEFVLHGDYWLGGEAVTGTVRLSASGVKDALLFSPASDGAYAEVRDVTIGVNFHWQRREVQCFKGDIRIVRDGDRLALVNILPIEDYLASVISSEMSATSSLELLKAHAVISRSWLLAQIRHRDHGVRPVSIARSSDTEYWVRWYGHDDHELFDVCADDHCQRYQGITRQTTPAVAEAVRATAGEVLMYGDELCDARFSKCCGGMMEQFEYCWEDEHKPYLVGRRDDAAEETRPDLRDEEAARQWILSSPPSFCNTADRRILSQVLNGYDQETADFYRWRVSYDNEVLSQLILRKTGLDFGRILDLVPVERGTSGRISLLRIEGDKLTKVIGKELEIRRVLSESHLYSSAFVVEHTADDGFVLHGAGWGHGVGLCQIGAAVMADRGYTYRDILAHYYPSATLRRPPH